MSGFALQVCMTAVEIEEAVSGLAARPFNASEFPYDFLAAFGNKETTLAKLRRGASNASDVTGGVLQRSNIHILASTKGDVGEMLTALRESTKTKQLKAKFILATDGETLQAEDLNSGEIFVSEYAKFADHFGFFLPLAGISTVKEIKDNPIDIKATGRLNKLYVELLTQNPEWAEPAKRPELNHFLARLIFCFFAEDTNIFDGDDLFTTTIKQMSEASGGNLNFVLSEIFRAMDVKPEAKGQANLPGWARPFPYVNGNLFSGSVETPKFSKIARSYLIRAGELDWREINPDIFGSMIQAVADDEERGSLGMHYTSVPNILKVLNPLFLDDLREQLGRAGDHKASLLKLRERMSKIRVFDPACGSGNFLVIAYKEMRTIESEINCRRGEKDRASDIDLTNFRGIEIRDFAAEIARLALIIAEFQCDVKYRGNQLALKEVLPLEKVNWIICGNALRLDWHSVCEPEGRGHELRTTGDDLFTTPLTQSKIEFKNEGGETYICGNPPYLGKGKLSIDNKRDLENVFRNRVLKWGYIDLVGAWFLKASDFCRNSPAESALVATNSVVMGRQAIDLWPAVLASGIHFSFAHTSFSWSNNAKRNAAVYVVVIGLTKGIGRGARLFENGVVREVKTISQYLTGGEVPMVLPRGQVLSSQLPEMNLGNKPNDGKLLRLTLSQKQEIVERLPDTNALIRPFFGSDEFNGGTVRYCLWISDENLEYAKTFAPIAERIESVRRIRLQFSDEANKHLAVRAHQMREFNEAKLWTICVPISTSERREYLPSGVLPASSIVSSQAFSIFDAPLWALALLNSRMHIAWIGTICGKFKEDYRYSNDLGWNTFPVPILTEQNRADLTRCAEDILLARERHFPKTIADLYDPEEMPEDLRRAHEKNDETLERIYIGRRFHNDTERLEKLFELYAKMTAKQGAEPKPKRPKKSLQVEELELDN